MSKTTTVTAHCDICLKPAEKCISISSPISYFDKGPGAFTTGHINVDVCVSCAGHAIRDFYLDEIRDLKAKNGHK